MWRCFCYVLSIEGNKDFYYVEEKVQSDEPVHADDIGGTCCPATEVSQSEVEQFLLTARKLAVIWRPNKVLYV